MPNRKDGSWVPQDVDRIASEKAQEILTKLVVRYDDPKVTYGHQELKQDLLDLMMAERDNIASMLKDPRAVHVNILRGGIVLPSDYARLHDADGPVAEKVNRAVNEQIERDIEVFKQAIDRIFTEEVLPAKAIEDAVKALRKQKRK